MSVATLIAHKDSGRLVYLPSSRTREPGTLCLLGFEGHTVAGRVADLQAGHSQVRVTVRTEDDRLLEGVYFPR